jgi:hypothetical protein
MPVGQRAVTLEAGVEADAFGAVHSHVAEHERFPPPKLWNAIGTGIGTLTPTMPIWMRFANSRAASPSRVKIAVPLPYSWSLTGWVALSKSGVRTIARTGPKISSL